ncbi:hypothetical protein GCM10028808_51850 [Spirosoma migulaei]
MRFIVTIFLLFFSLSKSMGQVENLLNTTWKYSRLILVTSTDSLDLYNSDSTTNTYDVRNIKITFKNESLYSGIDIFNSPKSGNWSLYKDQYLVMDDDTSQILDNSYKGLKIRNSLNYSNDDLNITGELITILHKIVPAVSFCESLKSGDWVDSSIWSCGHVPTSDDVVVINSNHSITVSTTSAQAQRIIYHGGIIRFSSSDSKIFVKGID